MAATYQSGLSTYHKRLYLGLLSVALITLNLLNIILPV